MRREGGGGGDSSDDSDCEENMTSFSLKTRPPQTTHKQPQSSNVLVSTIHYIFSFSPALPLLTSQQREWLWLSYDSASTSIWNFVTNSAEYLVDGQPVRRGVRHNTRPQSLPP